MNASPKQPQRILVIGGGIAGTAAALALRREGHDVELVERASRWRQPDIGVWLNGATFKALDLLGVLPEAMTVCQPGSGLRVCSETGQLLAEIPLPPPVRSDLPSGGSAGLPELHGVLASKAIDAGVRVRFDTTVERIEQDGTIVTVTAGGHTSDYDLVVGEDGIRSGVRDRIFPGAASLSYAGQRLWRVRLPAHPSIDSRYIFSGGGLKVGLSPLPGGEMYMLIMQTTDDASVPDSDELAPAVRDLLRGYRGVVGDARDAIDAITPIVAHPLQWLKFSKPWFDGRVVLVGDAVHPTTPQLGAGIGLAVEDAVVLVEQLAASNSVASALDSYMTRRLKRCRRIVENSQEIVRRQNAGGPVGPVNALIEQTQQMLGEPA